MGDTSKRPRSDNADACATLFRSCRARAEQLVAAHSCALVQNQQDHLIAAPPESERIFVTDRTRTKRADDGNYWCPFPGCDFISPSGYNMDRHLLRHGRLRKSASEPVYDALRALYPLTRKEVWIHVEVGEWRRVDFVVEGTNAIFIIELDGLQHKSASIRDELKRMRSIALSHARISSGLPQQRSPLWFIRFNPDRFRVNNKLIVLPLQYRLTTLLTAIDELDQSLEDVEICERDWYITYMFYDCTEVVEEGQHRPVLLDNIHYFNELKERVVLI